jgi:hypothetical protein
LEGRIGVGKSFSLDPRKAVMRSTLTRDGPFDPFGRDPG